MKRPKVGVSVAIRHRDLILLGKRLGTHSNGMWGFPGGHMEGGESFESCVIRETAEETGILLPAAKLWTIANTIFYTENKHYVVVFMVADMPAGQAPHGREPDRCDCWKWYPWPALPSPLMPGIEYLVAQGFNPLAI